MARRENDLIERTYRFAQRARRLVNVLPRSISNYEDSRQLVRASGSVAANYLESQEGLSRRDFFYRIKICRKESRECMLWLRLLDVGSGREVERERSYLVGEAEELKKIFSSIANKDDSEE